MTKEELYRVIACLRLTQGNAVFETLIDFLLYEGLFTVEEFHKKLIEKLGEQIS